MLFLYSFRTTNLLLLVFLSIVVVAVATASNFKNFDNVDVSSEEHHHRLSMSSSSSSSSTLTMSGQDRKQRTCSKVAPPCPPTDYVFIMDESSSIDRQTEYNQMRDFVSGIVNRIPDNDETRIGIIEFDDTARTVLPLESNRVKVNKAIDATRRQNGGSTATEKAVFKAIDMLSDASRNRVMILLTDGEPYRSGCDFYSICQPITCDGRKDLYVGDAIENFKTASNTTEGLVILIGIGGVVDDRTSCVSTSEDTIYEGDTFDDLPDIEDRLTNADLLCLANKPPQFECQDITVVASRGEDEVIIIEPEEIVIGGVIIDPENKTMNVTLDRNTLEVGATTDVTLSVDDGENDCSCTAQVSVVVPPTAAPSNSPTTTVSPSSEPSATPTISSVPSIAPTTLPTSQPSSSPTVSSAPSVTPTSFPTAQPSANPSKSLEPTFVPTSSPSANPSAFPTTSTAPSEVPTSTPSTSPSAVPTVSNVAPIAQCKQGIVEIPAEEGCLGFIGPEDIDQGSYDPDGDPISLSCDTEVLSFEHLNQEPVTVTLTVSDGYLESTCTSKVVLTKERPKAICVDVLRIPAVPGPNCESERITVSDIYNGSPFTNHLEIVLSDSGPFQGSHQPQTVELTVTESHCKLSDSCRTEIIVEDQGAVVEVDCDTPGELPICQKPIDVYPTAVSTTTGCPATVSSVALNKCQFCNGAGKVIDKTKGCGVEAHNNDQAAPYLTVNTPPGVGTFISYEVEAWADFGPAANNNKVVTTCVICVERCGQGGGNSKPPFFRGPFNCPALDKNGLPPTWDDDSGLTCY